MTDIIEEVKDALDKQAANIERKEKISNQIRGDTDEQKAPSMS